MQALAAVAIFESVIAALSVRRVFVCNSVEHKFHLELAFKTVFLVKAQAVGDTSEAN